MSHFSTALRLKPASAVIHYNLAGLFLQLGRTGEARDQLAIALRLDPDDQEARRLLEAVAGGTPPSPGGTSARDKASIRTPLSADTLSELGSSLLRSGGPGEPAARFFEALRLQPDLVAAHGGLGLALLGQGKTAEGIAQLREAVRLAPEDPVALVNLGIAVANQGKAEEAMSLLTRGVELAASLPDGHFNPALLLAAEGNPEQAIQHLETVLRIDPQQSDARRILEELRRRSRQAHE